MSAPEQGRGLDADTPVGEDAEGTLPTGSEARAAAPDGRFVAGDPLRGAAAMGIILYHFAYGTLIEAAEAYPDLEGDFFTIFFGDALGVVLRNLDLSIYVFLVLSGYLIGRPFVRAYIEGDTHPRLRPYLLNRALRIVPAFWAILTILLIRHGTMGSSPGEIAAIYGFAQNFFDSPAAYLVGPAWTINVEACYYLLVPLVAWLVVRGAGRRVGRRGRSAVVWGVLAAAFAGSLVALELLPDTFTAKRSILALGFAFVPGLALAVIEIDAAPRARAQGKGAGLALWLAALGVGVLVLYAIVIGDELGFMPEVGVGPRVLGLAGSALIVAAPLVQQWSGRRPWRLFDNRPLHWFGRRAYSAYLLHSAIFLELLLLLDPTGVRPRRDFFVMLALGLPIVLLLSAISFRLFERPFLERRRRWRT